MIPEKILQQMYLSDEFLQMPCCYQSLALEAFEKALLSTGSIIVEGNYATND